MGKNSRESFKDGGKLPFMKDTSWNRLIQRIVTDEGVQKGMITVIAETGVNTKGLNTEKMRQILQQYQVQR